MVGGLAAGLAAMTSGSAAIGILSDALFASIAAGVGVAAAALSGFLSRREAIHQDRKNADRLRGMLSELENLSIRLDDVREGVEAGSQSILIDYVTAVHSQISAAQEEWTLSTKGALEAIKSMDETLTKLRNKQA
jgi:hypothetical protein